MMMHKAEVQLVLDGAMADLEAERIKSLPKAAPLAVFSGFSGDDGPAAPEDPQQFEAYMVVGFDADLDEALRQFSVDLGDIIRQHGHDNLRWRRGPKLTRSVDDGCTPHWKITARLVAALTPEAAAQLPAAA